MHASSSMCLAERRCCALTTLEASRSFPPLRARPIAIGALSVVLIGSLVTIDRGYGGNKANWRDAVDYFAAAAEAMRRAMARGFSRTGCSTLGACGSAAR